MYLQARSNIRWSLVLVLVISGFLSLGGACNFYDQAKNVQGNTNTGTPINSNVDEIDTSDWLTYTNEEYGFSFRYPNNYTVELENEPFGKVGSSKGDIYIYSEDYSCYILFSKPTATIYNSVSSALENGSYYSITDVKKVSFNNVSGISYVDTVNEQHEQGIVYALIYNNLGFRYFIRNGVTISSCVLTAEAILNTIQLNS